MIEISKSELQAFYQSIQGFSPDNSEQQSMVLDEMANFVAKKIHTSAPDFILSLDTELSVIAGELHKPKASIEISGDDVLLSDDGVKVLEAVLIHVLRNSMAHGIESEDERNNFGKPKHGVLSFHFAKKEGYLDLTIKDDGRGLNLSKIKNKAKLGCIEVSSMPDEQIADLICMEDLSTRDSVSMISGIGIGMSSVRSTLETVEGSIGINLEEPMRSREGDSMFPFSFSIRLPSKLWMSSTNSGTRSSNSKCA
ncbi:MAG: hypothetical protein HRU19_27380 [Pseudobacteriovorax sp.]|nr:hypothetical protein [Pseudobacteriovorax sp.]